MLTQVLLKNVLLVSLVECLTLMLTLPESLNFLAHMLTQVLLKNVLLVSLVECLMFTSFSA